jgi:hypothetical protein
MEIGSPERVDHRSLKRQGIERAPEQHMGPQASAMERREQQRAEREQRAYEPVTRIGMANAAVREFGVAVSREVAAEIANLREYVRKGETWLREQQRQLAERVAPMVERVTEYLAGFDITALAAGAGAKMQADDRARIVKEQQGLEQGKGREAPQHEIDGPSHKPRGHGMER